MQITIEAKDALELRDKILDLHRVFAPVANQVKLQVNVNRSEFGQKVAELADNTLRGLEPVATSEMETHSFDDVGVSTSPAIPPKKAGPKAIKPKKIVPPVEDDEDDAPAFDEGSSEEELVPEAPLKEISTKAYTSDDTVKALQEVNSKQGIQTARKILGEFNCTRISELQQKNFGKFVQACKAVLQA